MAKGKKKTQQTLESTLGRPLITPAIKTPKRMSTRSSMKQSKLPSSPAPVVVASGSESKKSSPFSSSASPVIKPTTTRSALKQTKIPPFKKSSSSPAIKNDAAASSSSLSKAVEEEGRADAPEREEEEYVTGTQPQGRRQKVVVIDSDSDDVEDEAVKEKESEDEEDSDDMPLTTPVRTRKRPVVEESDEDYSDLPVRSSPAKRRRVVVPVESSDEEEEATGDEESDAVPIWKIPKLKKKPLTAKEKARELLRRKRAGEVIEEGEGEDEEDEPRKALYDTDSDHLALGEFEDDEESEQEAPKEEQDGKKKKDKDKKKQKEKKKEKVAKQDGSDDQDTPEKDLEDFVVDDSDEPLGVPDEVFHDMPIEFTRASHKPLKDHFRDVIEWLVQFKVNPGFADKTHSMYALAWRKMDDEVRALADSKFSSSAWKPDFYKALRARPYYVNEEIPPRVLDPMGNCAACGRSGHVAKWSIKFSGTPYFKNFGPNFLNPIEPDSDDDDDEAEEDEDEDGNPIPKEDRVWKVGNVCNDNAEIAHTLLHWKWSLLDWVDVRLMEDGHMLPERLAERSRWKPKKLYKLVDEIVEGWEKQGVVKSLFGDFKSQLERARSQGTGGRRRWGS
ncbi:hypothetical protein QBC38DRAFT_356128 [Podospora fimiseda]|uniref:DUF4211 domain-containing protein n=1 Tax=Podospora fimiseda TaxID=252190 RepID=A0AAN7BWP7_9PEZI|nr:hypothetical protein QBC38DRAFT_356128 [Podospora fimiseda]